MATYQLSNLKFYINPAGEGKTAMDATAIASYGTPNGYIAFDEVAHVLYVHGAAYGVTPEQATALSTAVTDIATLKGNKNTAGSVLNSIYTITGDLPESLVTGNVEDTTEKTVAQLISALKTQITNLSTTVSQNAANAVQISDGETTLTNTNAIKAAIAAVVSDGADAATDDTVKGAKMFAQEQDAATKLAIEGNGAVSSSATVLNPNQGDNNVWLLNEEKTLTHLKELINDLTSGDLSEVHNAITAIKNELRNSAENDPTGLANTILDKLANFFNDETSWTVNSETVTTIGGIIEELEEEIANNSTTDQAYTDSEIAALDAEVTSNDGTNVQVKVTEVDGVITAVNVTTDNTVTESDIDDKIAALDADVYGADGQTTDATTAASSYASDSTSKVVVKVTETDGKITGVNVKTNDVASAATLSTVQTTANNALPKGSTTYTNASDLETGIKNELKGTKASGDTTAETIRGAKDYADAAAAAAAGNVVSWTFIGE